MTVEEKVELFQGQLSCEGNLYTWCYDANGQLLHSNCPQEMLFATAFSLLGSKDAAFAHGIEHDEPIQPGTSLGLIWNVAFEKEDGILNKVYVLGPVFSTETSLSGIGKAFKHYGNLEISISWMNEFTNALLTLPVVPHIIFTRYAMMLHYCITGQTLGASDIFHSDQTGPTLGTAGAPKRDRHKIWSNEQVLLRMVREGDLNYKDVMDSVQMLSNGVPVQTGDPLRQGKDSLIVFTSLCTRAAIEGGLSPEQAYSLGDAYIQSIEDAATYSDMAPIAGIMYDDFVRRVRKCRTNPNVSRQIQNCLDYIEMHVEEKIRLATLAEHVGYSEYYLSHKFKAEMNCTVNDYIQFTKIERAKIMLSTTEDSIQSIAERLDFCSRSYFGGVFRKVAGCSPVEYRDENKKT